MKQKQTLIEADAPLVASTSSQYFTALTLKQSESFKRRCSQLAPINDQEQRKKLVKLLSSESLSLITLSSTRNKLFTLPRSSVVLEIGEENIDLDESNSNLEKKIMTLPTAKNFKPGGQLAIETFDNDLALKQKKFLPFQIPSTSQNKPSIKLALENYQADNDQNVSNDVLAKQFRKRLLKKSKASSLNQNLSTKKQHDTYTEDSSNKVLTPVRNKVLESFNLWIRITQEYQQLRNKNERRMLAFKLKIINKNISKLQKLWRFQQHQKLLEQQSIFVQKNLRRFLAKRRIKSCKQIIIKLQSYFRMLKARKSFSNLKMTTVILQSLVKCRLQRSKYTNIISKIPVMQSLVRMYLCKYRFRRVKAAVKIQSLLRMHKQRVKFVKYITEKRRKEAQQRMIEEQKKKAIVMKQKKEAVRTIERYWTLILLRRQLMEKKKQWEKLPIDCRLLWMRFSALKEQAFDLKEEISSLKRTDKAT